MYTALIVPETQEQELLHAQRLLLGDEKEIPETVKRVVEYCVAQKIGFVLSRNQNAGNCRDARSKRHRLGHIGIPLYDELKTIIGVTKDKTGNSIVVAMHCRGHMAINLEQVIKNYNFQTEIDHLPEDELWNLFAMKFGSVNPFLLDLESKQNVFHVFDSEILKPMAKFPGTMMTNAGDHTWGIEFDPNVLVDSIENKDVGQIAIPDIELNEYELPHRLNSTSIGIITGDGPDSGIALWQGINEYIVEFFGTHFLGDISLPKVSIISVPAIGLSTELDQREQVVWQSLSEAVSEFEEQKVDVLALASHTAHYFTEKIRKNMGGNGQKFVSMSDIVIRFIEENNWTDFAILGIQSVADLGYWSAYSKLKERNVEKLSYETMQRILQLGYDIRNMSQRHKNFQQLIGLIRNEVKSENIIIASTELSVLLQDQGKSSRPSQKNIVDALHLYADAIAKKVLGM